MLAQDDNLKPGTWGDQDFKAASTGVSVTSSWYSESFGATYSSPHFVGGIVSYAGADGVALRYQNLSSAGVELMVQEDTTQDTEVNHTAEEVHYLVFDGTGNGALVAEPLNGPFEVETKYYFAGARRVAVRRNGTLFYLHGDHLGSTSLTTNSSGGKVAEMKYMPFAHSALLRDASRESRAQQVGLPPPITPTPVSAGTVTLT